MTLNFCKICGGILRSQKIDNNHTYLFCDHCQEFELVKTSEKSEMTSEEKIENQEIGEGVKKDGNIFANYHNICKKCGYNKAQILDLGVFYSDEDNLILLQCGRCGFSERVGRKVS